MHCSRDMLQAAAQTTYLDSIIAQTENKLVMAEVLKTMANETVKVRPAVSSTDV